MSAGPPVTKTTILPFTILARQIIVVQFGNREPVADKHRAGFDILRRVRTDAENGIVTQLYRLHFAVAQQIERAARFVNPHHLEIHGLPVTIDARGLQTRGTKLLGHVVGGFLETAAAGVPALEAVVGKKPHVRPPVFAQRSPVGAWRDGSPTHKC